MSAIRVGRGRIVLLILVAGLAVEALLLARLWAQASAQAIDSNWMEALFAITDGLAGWPAPLTGKEPVHVTGVIDYAVLLAAEVYFVTTLTLLAVTMAAMGGWTLFGRLRAKDLPRFVREQLEHSRRRPIWQPVRSTRVIGLRYYVSLRRRDLPSPHTKDGLGG